MKFVFRMAFEDFIQHFTNLDICHFVNTSFFSLKKTWSEGMVNGAWMDGARGTEQDRSGGDVKCRTFLQNPQVRHYTMRRDICKEL